MDALAQITHQKLALTRNPIIVNVDPVVLASGLSRVDLRYFLTLWVQKSFQAGEYTEYATLEASEAPTATGSTTSAGAYFELQARLNDLLGATLPAAHAGQITVCPDLIRRYYYVSARYNGEALLDTTNSVTSWAIRAGVSERDYAMYRDLFFTSYIGDGRRFLTWQPDHKSVLPQQPEFLYFVTNFSPAPASLQLRVQCYYEDRTSDTHTAMSIADVTYMTAYALPVGYDQLGLASRPKPVLSYQVWLSNEATEQVSEARTFRVDYRAYESTRFVLFQNGLGGYDTVACLGVPATTVKVERQILQRFQGYDYLFTAAEELVNAVSGERSLTLNLGTWLNRSYRAYLEDLLFSEQFYLLDGAEFVPLTPLFEAMSFDNPREWPIERTLSFRYANRFTRYSQLPVIVKEERPTSWRQWTTSCELGANGVRTGKRIVNELVKYYLDSGENVRPLITKPNVPGTEGYIAPWETDDCAAATTPYLSALLSRASSKKRSNCAAGQVGSTWTITVAAGAFGSEQSQADANAKAEVRYTELDTQPNADASGTCVAAVPIPLAIHNQCPGDANGSTGPAYNPVVALLVNGAELIPNTSFTNGLRFADTGISAGSYMIDVRCIFAGQPTLPYKIRIPSKNLASGTLHSNQTHRFANVVVNWGDADLIVIVEPAP